MADERFLVVKLGSLGDLVFTLPAVSALRESFPRARIDWVVERRWACLLEGNPDVNEVVLLDRGSWIALFASMRRLRAAHYTCAIDFQGLYKSAALALLSGATERVGFARLFAREPASITYTRKVAPSGAHMVDQNLGLVEAIGARRTAYRFPLRVRPEAEARVIEQLARRGVGEYFVLSPGGGWRSKCWPPERYGRLHHELAMRYGWRGVVSFGRGEEPLADAVRRAAGEPKPVLLELDLAELMAVLQRAKLVVAGDTGPLHLAAALGTPVVGLYGPTTAERNGPFGSADIVVCNARPEETTLRRGRSYSRTMLSITVEQVAAAVAQRLGNG